MQTNNFTPKSTKIFKTPKEISLGVKNYHFWEMTPGLWVWCRKIVETSKTCKILLHFGLFLAFKHLCSIRTRSSKYVHFLYLGQIRTNGSQRALTVQKLPPNYFLGLFTWKLQKTPKSTNYTELQQNFSWSQKLRFFEKLPQVTLLDEFNVEK